MNAKEYLTQAYRIDQRISGKIEQVKELHILATKATSTVSDMPGSPTRNIHRMEYVIVKIVDLEDEINSDISDLVDLKAEITGVIKSIDNVEFRTLLEFRYLCYRPWEQIAVDLGYSIDNVFKKHRQAVKAVEEILDKRKMTVKSMEVQ